MEKIKTVFVIDRNNGNVAINEFSPECVWVANGEGIATIKFDGTSCRVLGGKLFKRYDAKAGRIPPEGFEPCGEPDPVTGHNPGWVPVTDAPENRFHIEAFGNGDFEDGTYELVGPKIQKNRYNLSRHELWKHGSVVVEDAPRDYDGLREWLNTNIGEGLVFHHPDGRMAKVRRKDFKISW